MAWLVQYSTGSLIFSKSVLPRQVTRARNCIRCAVQVPLKRPVSPIIARSKITQKQLLDTIGARTPIPNTFADRTSSRETVELAVLINVLPKRVRDALDHHIRLSQLVEVVLDLGRPVIARFTYGSTLLSQNPLTQDELDEVTSQACTDPARCRAHAAHVLAPAVEASA